jgi:hypothetical protein
VAAAGRIFAGLIAFREQPCNGSGHRRLPWKYCAVLGFRLLVLELIIAEEQRLCHGSFSPSSFSVDSAINNSYASTIEFLCSFGLLQSCNIGDSDHSTDFRDWDQ